MAKSKNIQGYGARPPGEEEFAAHPGGVKGRGTFSNVSGRFEREHRVIIDDGWRTLDGEPPVLKTSVAIDATRTIIARNQSPDISFDRSINPYRGCEHGCVYCFARPTHAYLGLSPGQDFESRLFAKPKAGQLLAQELRKAGYEVRSMALGTNTDPYQPIDEKYQVTRDVLKVLRDFKHPVGIVTKSNRVLRDLDILSEMASMNLARVAISVTTLDRKLARSMEPRAPTPERRIDAIRELSAAGVPTAVMAAPMIPALNDHEMEAILERAYEAGARQAGYVALRLPLEIKDLFREWLENEQPGRASHVMSLIRSMRGGKDYDAEWGKRMKGTGVYAELMAKRFKLACERIGLNKESRPLRTDLFCPPPMAGDQLSLL
ncbi:MAG: PA0069 family radical SAM protein [Alphaproteobacteria bacterium]|nr:PA0069 family radical SAM protein [Alphaproteobacteria bacterium]